MSLIAELRRRNVIRMAGLYLVGAWLIAQVAETILPAFEVPNWVLRAIVIVLVLGFIPALVVAWVFELTPQGLKRDQDAHLEESIAPKTAQRMNRMIVVLLALAVLYFGFDKFVLAPRRDAALVAAVEQRAAPPASTTAVASNGDASIAVLPFVNMSSDKEQDYFSDGLSEELLNQLAQIPQLRVIARTSSFSFKGKEVDVATIARKLNVDHVLEGSVRKSGHTLRITAQLIRASDSSHLWSHTYDRDMSDVFKVQDEISNEVVAALKVKLLPDQQITGTQRTDNVQAYEQFLIATDYGPGSGRESVEKAVVALRRAVALDPRYANAYAFMALQLSYLADFADGPKQRSGLIKQAVAAAEKAMALAPDLAVAYAARGSLRYRLQWDWKGADADFSQAVELDPNDVATLISYAYAKYFNGHAAQAIAMVRKATVIDPLSTDAWMSLGWILFLDDRMPEARPALQRAIELAPDANWPAFLLGSMDLLEGRTDSARVNFQRAPEHFALTGMAMLEHTLGNDRASQQAMDALEAKYSIGFAYQIAEAHAWRGDTDAAFQWLDRAYAQHDAGMGRLRQDQFFASLRGDPRFTALVKQMGFPE